MELNKISYIYKESNNAVFCVTTDHIVDEIEGHLQKMLDYSEIFLYDPDKIFFNTMISDKEYLNEDCDLCYLMKDSKTFVKYNTIEKSFNTACI